MIQSICPNCGNKKVFSDDKSGKKYKCPNCSDVVTIESIGTAITNEHQANVTNTYAASIEQAEQNNRIEALQQEHQKLVRKSKNENIGGNVCLIIGILALLGHLTGDGGMDLKDGIPALLGLGIAAIYLKNKSKKTKEKAEEFFATHLQGSAPTSNSALSEEDQRNIDEYYNEQSTDSGDTAPNSQNHSDENIKASLEKNSEMLEGVYITNNANLVQSLQFVGDVSASSGWSGLAEDIGIKNAQKSLVNKVKTLNGNVVLITESSTDWGIKIKGKAYVC